MNRQEYLNALRQQLNGYSAAFIEEITEAFEEHFLEGESNGLSETEVIEMLGSVEEVAENIRMMNNEQYHQPHSSSRIDLSGLSDTIGATLHEAANIVNDGLSSLRANGEAGFTKDMLEMDGEYEVIDIETRHSVDIRLAAGNSLSYRFIPMRHMLLGNLAELSTASEGDTALFKVFDGNGKLDITVPPGIKVIHVTAVGGDIYCRNLKLDELNAETRSGDIKVFSSDCRLVNASAVSGDIRLESTITAGSHLSTVSGDVDFKRSSGRAECSTVSGDIDIKQHDGETADAHTVSGDVEIHSTALQVNVGTTSGDIDLDLLGHFDTVSAATVSGDVTCRPYHDDYSGSLRTTTGSIEVKADIHVFEQGKRQAQVGTGSGRLELVSKSGDVELK